VRGLSQHIFKTAVALSYKTMGLDIFGRYKWLLTTQLWSPQQRLDWRLHRLGDILEFTWNHVPFYREYWGDHGVKFCRPKAMEELQDYPVLTKDIFRANSKRI
jgi:phenylacetate-CoA ligase